MELYEVPGHKLDEWIMNNLQSTSTFNKELKNAVHRIAEILKTQEGVIKVVKGGSTGKGTLLKDTSDADLVIFLQCFKSFQDQREIRGPVISKIYQMLKKCRQSIAFDMDIPEPKERRDPWGNLITPRSLTFTIKSRKGSPPIEVDVLPAFDAIGNFSRGSIPDPQVYVSLIDARAGPSEFSPCFTELQKDFVKISPTKLKSLIRLVKHWYKQYVKSKYPGKPLPHKYALELLTIYVWQKDSREDFKTEEGFCTFLKLLSRPRDLCIYWTKYYNFQNPVVSNFLKEQLKKPGPIILDPADPTGIMGLNTRWDLVAKEAAFCLTQPCCKNRGGDPLRAWDVPLSSSHTLMSLECLRPSYSSEQPSSLKLVIIQDDQVLLSVFVRPNTKIQQVKERIQSEMGISIDTMSLFREDQELMSHYTLAQYGIFSGTILKLKTQGSYCTIL